MCFSSEMVGKKPSLFKYDASEVYEGFTDSYLLLNCWKYLLWCLLLNSAYPIVNGFS